MADDRIPPPPLRVLKTVPISQLSILGEECKKVCAQNFADHLIDAFETFVVNVR